MFDDVGNISSSVSVEDVRLSILKLMYIWQTKTDKRGIERRISGNYCLMNRKKTDKRGIERRLSGNYYLMYRKKTEKRGIERRLSGNYYLMYRKSLLSIPRLFVFFLYI
jgi:hypothetical protein